MPCNDILNILQQQNLLDVAGRVFYSSHDTLDYQNGINGRVAILGSNPNGNPNEPPIQDDFNRWLLINEHVEQFNEYLDMPWNGRPPGQYTLQRRVAALCAHLNLDLRHIYCSNIMFQGTIDLREIPLDGYNANADICWPVHQYVFDIIQPTLILAYGNGPISAYKYLETRFLIDQPEIYHINQNQNCKSFVAPICGQHIRVIGIPHLSWFIPGNNNAAAIEWVRQRIPDINVA